MPLRPLPGRPRQRATEGWGTRGPVHVHRVVEVPPGRLHPAAGRVEHLERVVLAVLARRGRPQQLGHDARHHPDYPLGDHVVARQLPGQRHVE